MLPRPPPLPGPPAANPGRLLRSRTDRGTEGLPCERLEVLGEAAFCDLIQACPAYLGDAIGFPGSLERPPEEPAHDRPDGAAPIASRMEPLLPWTGRGRQRPAQHHITRRVWRVEGQE